MALGEGLRVEPLAGLTHQVKLPGKCRDLDIGVQSRDFGERHFAQAAGGTGVAVEQAHAAGFHVNGADEISTAPDRPRDRCGVDRQRLLDLVNQIERVAALPVHLVYESDDRDITQSAHLEKLACARLDALGSVDHHDS